MADSLVQEFLVESTEGLDRLDRDFVVLEKEPANPELLGAIFRVIHTIKGSCGFLGFTKLEALAHAGESLLSLLRDRKLDLNREIADALLAMVDAIRAILANIQSSETEGPAEYASLIETLSRLQRPGGAPAAGKSPTAPLPEKETAAPETKKSVSEKVVAAAEATKDVPEKKVEPNRNGDARQPATADSTIRVDVNLLEKQMNLVSELVLVRNRLLQLANRQEDRDLNASIQGLNFVTSELRKNVMKTRMQPVNQLFDKFPRLVRDVSASLKKSVRLETLGGETELDKTLLEAIKDPVTHILRNSVDHGIESPEKRRAAGKPPEGLICMHAYHEGGNFHLDVDDDGAGIDAERVKQKAVAQGLITAAQAANLDEQQILNLVFKPGFSTAEKVTNVSGRGVGMDVVRTNIERIGGSVKLESVAGKGTAVRLDIPLTLATIPALIVRVGQGVFAIPQAALVEMVSLTAEDSRKKIETIQGVSVYRFRGTLLPLLSLARELRLAEQPAANDCDSVNLVVLRNDGRQFSMKVTQIRHTEEIVIKPLGKLLKGVDVFSGAAVLGDGRVALILDIPSFSRRAGLIARQESVFGAGQETRQAAAERNNLLLLSNPHGERLAIPLANVRRMEEFPASRCESMGGREVMQYRGDILPLYRLERLLDERRSEPRAPLETVSRDRSATLAAVVACAPGRPDMLLEVHKILGIVSVNSGDISAGGRRGISGSAVIQGRATELLDLNTLLVEAQTADLVIAAETNTAPVEVSHGR